MQVSQHFQQQLRQRSEMKGRLALPLHLRQGDLRARDGSQDRYGRWRGRRFLWQPGVQTFHLLALFFQTMRHLELDHRLDSRRQRQQVGQSGNLSVFADVEGRDADGLRLEPMIVSLSAPIAPVMRDASPERDYGRSIGQLHPPAQPLAPCGDGRWVARYFGDLVPTRDDLLPRTGGGGAAAPGETILDFLFETPLNFQQTLNVMLLEFRLDRRPQAGFITKLMPTGPRLGRQRSEFGFSPFQPPAERPLLLCGVRVGTKDLDTLVPGERLPRAVLIGGQLDPTGTLELITLSHPRTGAVVDGHGPLRADERGLNPSGQRRRGLPSEWRDRQVIIARVRQSGARLERGHLRVADIKHPHALKDRTRSRNDRQIQTIIGGVAADDLGGRQMAVRVSRHGDQFQLCQIRPMIFAIPQLHQPALLRHVIAAGGRGVNLRAVHPAHARHLQLVDRDAVLPERRFKALPSGELTQARQQATEPIVTELRGFDDLSSNACQQRLMSRHPLLDFVFGVVGLRKDEGQPNGQHPSTAQSRMRPMIGYLTVVGLRDVHLHQNTEQQGNRVKSYVPHFGCFIHAPNDTWKIKKVPISFPGNYRPIQINPTLNSNWVLREERPRPAVVIPVP